MTKKRFLLFAWYEFDASGGWDDLRATADTIDEAKAALLDVMAERNWPPSEVEAEIVDMESFRIVAGYHAEFDDERLCSVGRWHDCERPPCPSSA